LRIFIGNTWKTLHLEGPHLNTLLFIFPTIDFKLNLNNPTIHICENGNLVTWNPASQGVLPSLSKATKGALPYAPEKTTPHPKCLSSSFGNKY